MAGQKICSVFSKGLSGSPMLRRPCLWGRKGSDMTEQRNNNIADGRSCQAHADWSRPKAARGDVYLHTVSATGLNFLRAGTTCDSPLHPQGTEAQCLAHNRCSVNAFGVDP